MGVLLGSAGPITAFAAPYVGAGEAPIGESGDRTGPRKQALERARRAALEAALAEVEGGDAGRRERVLKAASAWTSAYRILGQGDDGATAKVEVEVEIDVARLEKVVQGASAAPAGVRLPPIGRITHQGCPEALVAGVDDLLIARGLAVAQGEGPALDVALRCEAIGQVPQARAWGAQVSVIVGAAGGAEEGRGVAFAGDPDAAAQEALGEALSEVGEALHRLQGGAITLRIASPWPAAGIRRVERAIGSSVVGVRAASVRGIEGDGAVLLRIDGTLSADDLATRLAALQIPGAHLRVIGVDGPRLLSATFGP